MGYIEQPYTSAGRIPTSKGYRFYVNSLMMVEKLTSQEKRSIKKHFESVNKNVDEILEKTSQVLGRITKQLGVAIGPRLSEGIFERMELIQISSNRLMVIISIKAGIAKTMMMEINSEIPRSELEETSRIINERLQGLSISEIRKTFAKRICDISGGNKELIRLFVDSSDNLFEFTQKNFHLGGTKNIIEQPEFSSTENMKTIIELIEDKNIIIHLLSKNEESDGIKISIGEENEIKSAKDFSVISSNYYIGNIRGTLGVIGPTRMRYSKIVSLVEYTANLLNNILEVE